jgi:predicted TIM-barrel fold metal-dependent hydrolase
MIEISGYQPHRAIEEIAQRFGARRLLFGSGLPVFEPGSAVAMVTYAELPQDQKQMIAGGNLESLLEQAKP